MNTISSHLKTEAQRQGLVIRDLPRLSFEPKKSLGVLCLPSGQTGFLVTNTPSDHDVRIVIKESDTPLEGLSIVMVGGLVVRGVSQIPFVLGELDALATQMNLRKILTVETAPGQEWERYIEPGEFALWTAAVRFQAN